MEDELFAAREWQAGAGVGVVWAWLTALAAAGPRLRRPLSEAPLRVGTVALVLVPRTGCCALLEYLAVQSLVAELPGDIRQRPGLLHACAGGGAATALLVAREPRERMLSLLRLHCVGGARWAERGGVQDLPRVGHGLAFVPLLPTKQIPPPLPLFPKCACATCTPA